MKKIYLFFISIFVTPTFAATSPFGAAIEGTVLPTYLVGAADSWWTMVGAGAGKGVIAAGKVSDAHTANIGLFQDVMSVIAYNDSPLTIFEIKQHVNDGFMNIADPLTSRKSDCAWRGVKCKPTPKAVIFDSYVFGGLIEFDSELNGNFETKRTGVNASVKAFLSEGFVMGLGITRTMTGTDDQMIASDIVSNSISLFGEYLSSNGLFINFGGSVGRTNWDSDKSIAGITDSKDYDTDFYAAQLNAGAKLQTGVVFFEPQIGARFTAMQTEQHIDSIQQNFDKWDYNVFTGLGSMRIGLDIVDEEVSFRPSVLIGAGYDVNDGGDTQMRVTLANNSVYYVPIESPNPFAFNTGLRLAIVGTLFETALDYRLDVRQNFLAHNLLLNLKLYF